jgi:methionine aminotransferase
MAYFIWDLRRYGDEADKDFSIRITKEYGVTTIPVSVFTGHNNKKSSFRFAKRRNPEAAVERLATIS